METQGVLYDKHHTFFEGRASVVWVKNWEVGGWETLDVTSESESQYSFSVTQLCESESESESQYSLTLTQLCEWKEEKAMHGKHLM